MHAATVCHHPDREAGPLRELVGHEPAHQLCVDAYAPWRGAELRCVAQQTSIFRYFSCPKASTALLCSATLLLHPDTYTAGSTFGLLWSSLVSAVIPANIHGSGNPGQGQ